MGDDLISVIEVASRHGRRKSTVFKVLRRLGTTATKQRSSSSENQLVACITQGEFRLVAVEMQAIATRNDGAGGDDEPDDFVSAEVGVFYLVQLEPALDPGRFKVGFAAGMSERLRRLRCSV